MNDALTLIFLVFLQFSTAVSPQKEVPWLVGPTLCPVPNSCAVPIALRLIQSVFHIGGLLLPAHV
jgi:hypothetical protein